MLMETFPPILNLNYCPSCLPYKLGNSQESGFVLISEEDLDSTILLMASEDFQMQAIC
jgi:hypothetical protein